MRSTPGTSATIQALITVRGPSQDQAAGAATAAIENAGGRWEPADIAHQIGVLFAEADIGAPDGTDVAGRLEPLADALWFFTGVYGGVLKTALEHGITSERDAAAWRAQIAEDAYRFPDRPALWPLLIGAWKQRR